jgi:hypothetical protein
MNNYKAQKAFDILNNKDQRDKDPYVRLRFNDYLEEELSDLIEKIDEDEFNEENNPKQIG